MVLDLKKVKLRHSLDAGTLYVVEQIPSYVEYSEQTDVLRKGIFFILEVGRMMSVYVCVCIHGGEHVVCECMMEECVLGKKGWECHC